MIKKAVLVVGVLFLLLAPLAALAEGGIKGRASQGGTLVEDITISAYLYREGTFGPLTKEEPAGVTTTATDGSYSLPLLPGRYIVEAHKKAEGNKGAGLEGGDLYCLYSGSPITVAVDRWTAVGLYLIKTSSEKEVAAKRTKVSGKITFQGEKVPRAYLYAYRTVDGAFRGPADMLQPVAAGTFSVRLPPGTYYLVARKRARGGAYGPMDTGDLFNFYPQNPVVLKESTELQIEIPLIERLSQLELEDGAYRGLSVTVTDKDGKPLSKYYVLGYSSAPRTGPPAATSGPTDEKGEAFVNLPPGARFLRARRSLGGPIVEGEIFADETLAEVTNSGAPITIKVE